ncbi:MAG: FxsA family protein [Oceanospirillales bacterium]|jgi:UPF0716 protein FxsA|uniref:FxsA family protein n=1 Tax=Marinobacter maritimus TaxID=277961 RepID=UPI000BCCE7A2|nr:FxsA family protein [Marinobacter maritimus]MBL1272270.1 FxsA family protein [Oceanospirillales bacterium]|tara:strand:- start:280 stop:822 length:543 start_codon:yes stop_codon:yes gene_type:complete
MSILLFVFIIMPIAEMAVLIQVGGMIGVFNTIGFVLLTAVVGAWLLRQQGLATLLKANQRLNSGELPAKEVAEGLILAVGGVLLLTPGFITDTIGFFCLIPFTRHWLAAQALKRMVASSKSGGFYFRAGGGRNPFGQEPFGDRDNPFGRQSPFDRDSNGDIIEGEYRDETKTRHERLDKK